MVRVTRAPARKRRIKKILKRAKGFVGLRGSHHTLAESSVWKADAYAFRDRKQKKRDFRSLWIVRINAACRCYGISYSKLVAGLTKANIEVNRKMLAHLAIEDQNAFAAVVEQAKKALV